MIVKVDVNNILAKMQLFILLAYPNNITLLNLERRGTLCFGLLLSEALSGL